MNVYKAVRDNMAVFLNPDKFDEFLNRGYLIYKVQDLENENLDKLLSADEIETLKNVSSKCAIVPATQQLSIIRKLLQHTEDGHFALGQLH